MDINTNGLTFYGKQEKPGNGTFCSHVTLNNAGIPTSIGFNFPESMLKDLPAAVGPQNLD